MSVSREQKLVVWFDLTHKRIPKGGVQIEAQEASGYSFPLIMRGIFLYKHHNPFFWRDHPGAYSYTVCAEYGPVNVFFESPAFHVGAAFTPQLSQAWIDSEDDDEPAPCHVFLRNILLAIYQNSKRQP